MDVPTDTADRAPGRSVLDRAEPRWRDIVSAAAVWLLGAVVIATGIDGTGINTGGLGLPPLSPWWHLAFLTPGCVLMLVKRSAPGVCLLAGLALLAGDLVVGGGNLGMLLMVCDLLFGVGRYGRPGIRHATMTGVLVVAAFGAVTAVVLSGELRAGILVVLQVVAIGVVPLWWAGNIRQQRELGELAVANARQESVDSERAAIARDLHDVVASRLSTTALHSGAALALPPDHERDRAALRAVRESSVAALDEMRAMIMVLRRGGAEPPATGRLADVGALVDELRAAGAVIELRSDVPECLPPLVEHGAHRIVREALTNAHRHGSGPVRLTIGHDDEQVVVEVSNPVPTGRRRATESDRARGASGGTGLWSMAERARSVGGVVEAGPRDGEWQLRAVLPRFGTGGYVDDAIRDEGTT